MPKKGVQRGTLKISNGDPLSPLYPSRSDMYRPVSIEEVSFLIYLFK